eukprot:TRINITY_DN5376_c0_g1_i2.p1 TRINITY_DN5376_c0_g1~~TRINITY_DN5376_c0_g1_i2.p1  ORF type:complete len:249 (-),score=51.60 TRINITY_DN5376_c0_g1_i2:831-1577(-)
MGNVFGRYLVRDAGAAELIEPVTAEREGEPFLPACNYVCTGECEQVHTVEEGAERGGGVGTDSPHLVPCDPALPGTKENALRVVCVSDTHGMHGYIKHVPEGDILVHAGDFSNTGETEQVQSLVEWLRTQPHTYKIVIAGNHDLTFDRGNYDSVLRERFHSQKDKAYNVEQTRALLTSLREDNIIYLEDEAIEIEGVQFYGSPWQPEFCGWGFNLTRGEELREVWQKIPKETQVLITHGPPKGTLPLL